jgi:hypothetical protein
MGLDADAIAVASGEMSVRSAADALEAAEVSRPIPLAAYRAGDWCVVFFVIKHSSGGDWTTEIVTVRGGEVGPSGGGTGGILRKSDVQPGKPVACGQFGYSLDDDKSLVCVEGVSADEMVKMLWRGQVVAEAKVAAHGHFVLAAALPEDAEVGFEAAWSLSG